MEKQTMKNIWTDMVGKYAAVAMKCGLWLSGSVAKVSDLLTPQSVKEQEDKNPFKNKSVKQWFDYMLDESGRLGAFFSFERFAEKTGFILSVKEMTRWQEQAVAQENVRAQDRFPARTVNSANSVEMNYQPTKNSLYTSILDRHERCEKLVSDMIACGLVLDTKEARADQLKEALKWDDRAFDAAVSVIRRNMGSAGSKTPTADEFKRIAIDLVSEHDTVEMGNTAPVPAQEWKPTYTGKSEVGGKKKVKTKKSAKTASKKKITTKKSSKTTKAKKSKGTKKR